MSVPRAVLPLVIVVLCVFHASPALSSLEKTIQGVECTARVVNEQVSKIEVAINWRDTSIRRPPWLVDLFASGGWGATWADIDGPFTYSGSSLRIESQYSTSQPQLTATLAPAAASPSPDFFLQLLFRADGGPYQNSVVRCFISVASVTDGLDVTVHKTANRLHELELDGYFADTIRLSRDGPITPPPVNTRNLSPIDNPAVPIEHQARLLAEIARSESENASTATNQQEAALGAAQADPAASSTESMPSGCGVSDARSSEDFGWQIILAFFLGTTWLLTRLFRRFMTRHHGRAASSITLVCLPLFAMGGVLGGTSDAYAIGGFYGKLTFWDSRGALDGQPYLRDAGPGSRLLPCSTVSPSCAPNTAGCCWIGVPRAKVRLVRQSTGLVVHESYTTDSGSFLVYDNNWSPGAYTMYLVYERSGYPGAASIKTPLGFTFTQTVGTFNSNATWTNLGDIAQSQYQDVSSVAGDLASIWATTTEVFLILEGEGETRHRREFGSSNAYDPYDIRYNPAPNTNAICVPQRVNLDGGSARANTVAHELGHIYHSRLVGCGSHGYVSYPVFSDDSPHSPGTGEGYNLSEAIPSVLMFLWLWDPQMAPTASPKAFFPCENMPATLSTVNDTSAEFNNLHAIWDLLDFDGTDTDAYVDYIDISVKQLFDGFVTLATTTGSTGQNQTADEAYYQKVLPPLGCTLGGVCAAGDICYTSDQLCYTGDVHGGNIRDWVHHVAANLGASVVWYWAAIESSKCVGPARNVTPFNGGYRSD